MANMSKEKQQELVNRALTGDQDALTDLYTMMEPLLRRTLYRIVPEEDLDDVIQKTMLQAFNALTAFNQTAMFSTWCRTIGVNAALGLRRQNKRREQIFTDSIDRTTTSPDGSARVTIDVGYIDTTADRNFTTKTVREAMVLLPNDQKMALELYLDGASLEETVVAMDMKVTTVKSVLFRAKKSLRKLIAGSDGNETQRTCKCGCGESIAARGWPYVAGHGKRNTGQEVEEAA